MARTKSTIKHIIRRGLRYLRVEDAAEKLGTTPHYLRHLCRNKKVLCAKGMGIWYVQVEASSKMMYNDRTLGQALAETIREFGADSDTSYQVHISKEGRELL